METFLIIATVISIFWLGMATGAIIENIRIHRVRTTETIITKLDETKEVLLPLVKKIDEINLSCESIVNGTWVDCEIHDPDRTLDIPVYESLTAELKLKEEEWQRNQESWED